MGQRTSQHTDTTPGLLELPPELVHLILNHVPLKDIPNVSRSCSILNRIVRSYLWSRVTPGLLTEWAKFLDNNQGLLTAQERNDNRIREVHDILDIWSICRLLSRHTEIFGQTRRVSCVKNDVTVVSDRDLIILWDVGLSRKTRVVDRVRWLQMTYAWQLDDPGKYQVSLRLRLEKNFTWPLTKDQTTVWSVKYPLEDGRTVKYPLEDGQGRLVVEVDKKWWRMVWRREQPEGRLKVEFDHDGWMNVIFPVIEITSIGHVTVELRDTVCNYWKGGVSFDYFQICKIS